MIEFYGGYQVYSESGVDLTLLRQNLELTTTQRLLHSARASRAVEAFAAEVRAGSNRSVQRGVTSAMLDIEGILRQLTTEQVEFVLIGGQAMIAHGSAYITKDVDICYSRTVRNISRLAAALESIHPHLRGVPKGLPFRFDAATIQAGLNFTLDTDLGAIDVLGEVSGIGGYDQALSLDVEKLPLARTFRYCLLSG
jgi:hypothetical protein